MASTEDHPQSTPTPLAHAEEKKAKPGAAWKEGETHVLPKNSLPVVFICFAFCTFLAALDQVSLSPTQPNPRTWTDPSTSFFFSKKKHVRSPRLDHCRDRIADNCPRIEGRRGLQLDWQVRNVSDCIQITILSSFSAYLLASAALAPLHGKLTEIVG